MLISGTGTRSSPISIEDDSEDEVFNELTAKLSSDDEEVMVYPAPHQGTYFAKLSKRHLSQEEARGLEQYRESLQQEVKKRKRADSIARAPQGDPLIIDLTGQQPSSPTRDNDVNTDITSKRNRKRRRKSETTPERSRKKSIESVQNNEGLSFVIKGGKKLRANTTNSTTQKIPGNQQITLSSNGESSANLGGSSTVSFLPDMLGCVSQHGNSPWPQLVSPTESLHSGLQHGSNYFHSRVLQHAQSMFPTPIFPSLPHTDLALPMLVNMAIGLENMAYMQQSSPYMTLATTSNIHSSNSSLPLKPTNTSYTTLPSRPNNQSMSTQSHPAHVIPAHPNYTFPAQINQASNGTNTTPNLPSNPNLQSIPKIKRKPAPIGNSTNVSKHGFFELPPPDPQQPNAPNDVSPPPSNRTLVMEQIPRPMRQVSWVNEWAVSACGQAPLHVLLRDKEAKALIEFSNSGLALTAWKSKRLGTNEDGEMNKGAAALYNARVYWYNPKAEERLKKKKEKIEKKSQLVEARQQVDMMSKLEEKEKEEEKENQEVKEDEKVTTKGNVEAHISTSSASQTMEHIPSMSSLRVEIEAMQGVREVEVEAVDQKLEEGEIVDVVMENHTANNTPLEPGEFDMFEEQGHRQYLTLKKQQEENKWLGQEEEEERLARANEQRLITEVQRGRGEEGSRTKLRAEKERQDMLDRQRAELLEQHRRRVVGRGQHKNNSKELQVQADIVRIRNEWKLGGRLEHEEREQKEKELRQRVLRERERISTSLPVTQQEILKRVAMKQKQQQSPPAFGIPTAPRLTPTSNTAGPSAIRPATAPPPLSLSSRAIPTGPRKAASSNVSAQPQGRNKDKPIPTISQHNAPLPPKPTILHSSLPPRPQTIAPRVVGGDSSILSPLSLSHTPVARPTLNVSPASDMDIDTTLGTRNVTLLTLDPLPSPATLVAEAIATASGPNSCAQESSILKSTLSLPYVSASVPVTKKRVPIAPKAMRCALEPSSSSGQAVKQPLTEAKGKEVEQASPSGMTIRENVAPIPSGLTTRQGEQSGAAVQEAKKGILGSQQLTPVSSSSTQDTNLSDAAISLIKEALGSVNLSSKALRKKERPQRDGMLGKEHKVGSSSSISVESTASVKMPLEPPRTIIKNALAEKQKLLEREIQVTKELMQQMARTQTRQDKERIMNLLREKSRFMDQVSKSIKSESLVTSGTSGKQVQASSRWTRMRWPESQDDAGVFIISDDEDDEEQS